MKNLAFSRFSAADQALLRVQVDQAIAAETEGQSFDWKSDKSRAAGARQVPWHGMPQSAHSKQLGQPAR